MAGQAKEREEKACLPFEVPTLETPEQVFFACHYPVKHAFGKQTR